MKKVAQSLVDELFLKVLGCVTIYLFTELNQF